MFFFICPFGLHRELVNSLLASWASCSLYADDTLVFDSSATCSGDGSSSCCELRRDLVSVGTWARAWNTTFNASKSNAMLVHARNVASQTSDVGLATAVIPGVRVVRHFGVILTEYNLKPRFVFAALR